LWRDVAVLDVYAGSGALGIEALSRGAPVAVFLEGSPAALGAIRENLRATGLEDRGRVLGGSVERTLGRVTGSIALVLMDPPYADAAGRRIAKQIAEATWLADDAIVALEHDGRAA